MEANKTATLDPYIITPPPPVFLGKKREIVVPKTYRLHINVLQSHLADYQDKRLVKFIPDFITHILDTAKSHDCKGRILGDVGINLKK